MRILIVLGVMGLGLSAIVKTAVAEELLFPAPGTHFDLVQSDVQRAVLSLVEGLVPGAELDSAQELDLSRILAALAPSLFANGLESGDDEIWVDGETLRNYLEPLRGWTNGGFQQLVDNVSGALLKRGTDHLVVNLNSFKALNLPLKPERDARNMQLYQVDVPQVLKFKLSLAGGIFRVWGMDTDFRQGRALRFRVKIPFISDKVYLRNFRADLMDGRFEVEAGLLGNGLVIVGKGDLVARRFDGIDFWESVRRNRSLISLPIPMPFQYR